MNERKTITQTIYIIWFSHHVSSWWDSFFSIFSKYKCISQETTSEQQDDSNINPFSGFWDWVTGEKEEVNKITLNKESLQIEEGKTEILTATTDPEDVSVSWSSSNSTVATVNSNGKITAKSVGTAVITATAGEFSVTCNVTVTRDTSTDSKQFVYFYSIYPGISTPGTGDNFQAGEWLYAGTGYANLPSISKVGEGYAITGDLGITDVPTDYYNKTITINGIQYKYDKDDTNDYGTFDIVWDKASVTSGANNSQKWDGESGINGSIIEGELCWHIDGHLVLHDEHMINIDFRLKDVGEQGFNSIRSNGDSYPYMCVKGTTIDEIRKPNKQNVPDTKKKNNMTYVFDGWYTDEDCTQKADFSNPDMEVHEDVTYYGQYVIKQARITTSATHATVTESAAIPVGSNKTVFWEPEEGYLIESVTIDGNQLSAEEIQKGSYTFTDIQTDHTVEVIAKIQTFAITTKATNATISESIEQAEYGSTHLIEWQAKEGYYIDSVEIDGKAIEITDKTSGQYEFTNIHEGHTVVVKAKQYVYSITTQASHATITESESNIPYGESRTVSWKAEDGYEITSVVIDDVAQPIENKVEGSTIFEDIQANHTVVVETKPYSEIYFYNLTTSAQNAQVTPSETNIPYGTEKTVTWTPNTGYHITSVLVDGQLLSKEEIKKGEYTFTKVTDHHSVIVNAEANTYTITTSGDHVTITPSMEVSLGNSSTITWTAHEGYYISKIIIDSKEEIVEEITATGSHTFENVSANHTIHIKTKPLVYSIQTSMTGGTITESMENIGYGTSQTIEWKADTNHEITSVVIDGIPQEIINSSEGAITFENMRENHTVEVTAQPFSDLYFYNITTSGTNSAVTESKENLPWGSSYTVSWKPAAGYHIVEVMVDNQPLTQEQMKAGEIEFTNIQGNHTVHVTSAINTYQIETSGENVTIDLSSTIEYGKSQTISFTANEGYYIDSILVDNQPITIDDVTQGSYTFNDVKENHSIEVHASLYTYDIHTEITNGIITEDIQDIDYGTKQTILWKVTDGYHVTSVLVNGEPIEVTDFKEGSYTFEKVTQDSSVVVQTAKNFTITTLGEHVSITKSKTNILPHEEKTIEWKADDGYYISSVIIDGHSSAISNLESDSYTFSNITENHTIEVKASQKFSITTQGTNVTIDDSLNNLFPNTSHTITWKAQDGYYITEVLVDGKAEEITDKLQGEYTFEAIQGNHSVVVKASKCFDILTEISHGTIDDSISNILPRENHEIHYAPEEGYYISEVIIDGTAYSYKDYPESYTFKDISSSHSIKVVCEPLKTVTTEIENGEITKTITGIHPDTDTKIIYKAFDDYYIYSVTVDGKEIDVDDFKEGSYSFKPTEKDHTITVVCQPKPTIYTSINNGDITSTFKVYPEESGTIQATPKEGYYIHRVTLDGEEVTFEDETKYELTIDNITKDHHIDVETTAYPDLEVKIFSNKEQYNYQDTIHYTIEATQLVNGTYGENLVITNTLPKGLTLDEDSIQVEGLEEDSYHFEVKDNEIRLQSERIDGKVSLEYDAKISSVDLAGTTLANKVSATMDRVKEEQTDSVKNKVLKPEVEISKTVVQEKYNVDDWVEYQIEVRQTTEGAKVQDIVIEDVLPEELVLDKESIKVEGMSEDKVSMKTDDHFLHLTISALNKTTPVTIRFKAQLSSDCMGKTLESTARLTQKDFAITQESPVSIQVYQPDFKIEQYTDKKSYKEKDVIRYTIIAEQIEEGAVGKNVRILNEIPEEILVNEQSAQLTGLEADTYSLMCDEKQLEVMIDEMQEGNPVTISFTGIVQKDTGTIENTTTLTSDTTKDKQYNVETEVEVKPEKVGPSKPDDGKNDGTNDGDGGNNTGANDGDSTTPPDMNTNSSGDGNNTSQTDGNGEEISEEIVEGNQTSTSNGYRTSPNTGLQVNSKPFAIGGGILCIVAILLFAVIRKRKE